MLTKEQQELIRTLSDQGMTIRKVKDMVGCSQKTVENYRRKFKITKRVNRFTANIIERLNAGARIKEVAQEFHLSLATISKIAKLPGCNWSGRYKRMESEDIAYRKSEMRRLLASGWTYERIGRLFNVSRQRVEQIINDTYEHTSSTQSELAERSPDTSSEHGAVGGNTL